jgi:hypothetical protein
VLVTWGRRADRIRSSRPHGRQGKRSLRTGHPLCRQWLSRHRVNSERRERCSRSWSVEDRDRRRSDGRAQSLQILLQSKDAVAKFLQRRSLIASAHLQILHVPHDHAKERFLQQSVKFCRVDPKSVCAARACFESRLEVIEIRADRGHSIREFQRTIPNYTIRLQAVCLKAYSRIVEAAARTYATNRPPAAPDEAAIAESSASLSAVSRGSPVNRVPILFVT